MLTPGPPHHAVHATAYNCNILLYFIPAEISANQVLFKRELSYRNWPEAQACGSTLLGCDLVDCFGAFSDGVLGQLSRHQQTHYSTDMLQQGVVAHSTTWHRRVGLKCCHAQRKARQSLQCVWLDDKWLREHCLNAYKSHHVKTATQVPHAVRQSSCIIRHCLHTAREAPSSTVADALHTEM